MNTDDFSCCKEYGCETCKTFPAYMDDGMSCEKCKDGLNLFIILSYRL